MIAMVTGPLLADSTTHESPDYAQAIAVVLAEDSRLGAARNEATQTQPIGQVVREYVAGLDAIDLQYCPPEFVTALRRHRDAWHDSIEFFDQFGAYRGELHDVFDMIRAEDQTALEGLEKVESAIWSTWEEVEKASGVK